MGNGAIGKAREEKKVKAESTHKEKINNTTEHVIAVPACPMLKRVNKKAKIELSLDMFSTPRKRKSRVEVLKQENIMYSPIVLPGTPNGISSPMGSGSWLKRRTSALDKMFESAGFPM